MGLRESGIAYGIPSTTVADTFLKTGGAGSFCGLRPVCVEAASIWEAGRGSTMLCHRPVGGTVCDSQVKSDFTIFYNQVKDST